MNEYTVLNNFYHVFIGNIFSFNLAFIYSRVHLIEVLS
jgi:hypothetical protein